MTAVLVSGIQHSGNRLIKRMLRSHGVDARVYHGTTDNRAEDERVEWLRERQATGPAFVIVPVRDEEVSQRSHVRTASRRAKATPKKHGELMLRHYRVLREHLAGIPMMVVPYEGLVADPEQWGRRIVEFCGQAWRGWPEKIFDGNKKYT